MTDSLPRVIKRMIKEEETPEATIGGIQSAFPYWSQNALRLGALADRGAYIGRAYQIKLDKFVEYTGAGHG